MRPSTHTLLTILIILSALIASGCTGTSTPEPTAAPVPQSFDADRAYQDVINQLAFGPRVPDSQAHQQEVEYIATELEKAGWQVEVQDTTYEGHPVQNIIGKRSETANPVILGAHYDSRIWADRDPDESLTVKPVPGANDGASGVAVLLEIARVLTSDCTDVWLVFFDAEDQGDIPGWDWILGSSAYADGLQVTPAAVVVIDMIGDADLNIYREQSSYPTLTDEIWQTAARLGYGDVFIDQFKYNLEDDHTPFLEKGLTAVDIIDFDYPWWHTTSDTTDRVSPQSLQIIGNVLLAWLADR